MEEDKKTAEDKPAKLLVFPVPVASSGSEVAPPPLFTFSAAGLSPGLTSTGSTFSTPSRTEKNKKETSKSKAWNFLEQTPWRHVNWSIETRPALLESIRMYKPACGSVPLARVLLVGPVGAGKSSFISSVQSVLYGHVLNRAMVGSRSGLGSGSGSSINFTKKLQSYRLHSNMDVGGESTAVVLSDMAGLGEGSSLTLHDALATIKGHVPDGHTFCACSPVVSDTAGYVKEPRLADRPHCVVFVLNAAEITTYSKSATDTIQLLREHASALGVHQVALLTHVDKLCPEVSEDCAQVYNSRLLRNVMAQASALLGMPVSSMVPVKNYSEELEPDLHTDKLLLKAMELILRYVDLHLREHADETRQTKLPVSSSTVMAKALREAGF